MEFEGVGGGMVWLSAGNGNTYSITYIHDMMVGMHSLAFVLFREVKSACHCCLSPSSPFSVILFLVVDPIFPLIHLTITITIPITTTRISHFPNSIHLSARSALIPLPNTRNTICLSLCLIEWNGIELN